MNINPLPNDILYHISLFINNFKTLIAFQSTSKFNRYGYDYNKSDIPSLSDIIWKKRCELKWHIKFEELEDIEYKHKPVSFFTYFKLRHWHERKEYMFKENKKSYGVVLPCKIGKYRPQNTKEYECYNTCSDYNTRHIAVFSNSKPIVIHFRVKFTSEYCSNVYDMNMITLDELKNKEIVKELLHVEIYHNDGAIWDMTNVRAYNPFSNSHQNDMKHIVNYFNIFFREIYSQKGFQKIQSNSSINLDTYINMYMSELGYLDDLIVDFIIDSDLNVGDRFLISLLYLYELL